MGVKYKVNENFFRKWSRNSAYILGFIFADGYLENAPYIRGKYIRLTSIDYSAINQIKQILESLHKIVVVPASGNRKEKYLLRIGSHKMYDDLAVLGLHPRKSLDMDFPKVPRRFLRDFIRGYFDGDGSIFIENMKHKPHNRLKVIFTSGSKNFLLSLSSILRTCCVGRLGRVCDSHRSYQLLYGSRDALAVLKFIYSKLSERGSLCLDRKYYKYTQLVSKPDIFRCGNLFDKNSRIWAYGMNRRRTQVA